jgi:anti-sigma B factor antagonist
MINTVTPSTGAGLSRERLPGHVLITLRGELDIATTPSLRDRLHAALQDPGPLVVIDLSQVTFCDASGLALLVGARRRTEPKGTTLVLAAPSAQLAKMLGVTGLHSAFTIRRSVASARLARPHGRSAAA